MSYDDALEAEIEREVARSEIEKRGLDWSEFIADVGDKETYRGSDILDWLGY